MPSIWMPPILALAAVQWAAGLTGFVCVLFGLGTPEPAQIPPWMSALQAGVAGGAGLWLLVAGRRDHRGVILGGFLLLVGASYSLRLIPPLADALGTPLGSALIGLRHLPADAFLPLFIWLFFADFPRAITSHSGRQAVRAAILISGAAGFGLLGVTALRALPGLAEAAPGSVLATFDRFNITSHYWTVSYGLSFPALPLAVLRSRRAPPTERRRVTLFLSGIAAAAIPAWTYILVLALVPSFLPWAEGNGLNAILVPLLQLAILSIPVTAAYSVGALRVLPVGTILRSALRYGLARGAILAAIAAPFAAAAALLVRSRDLTVSELLTGRRVFGFAAALAVGGVALGARNSAREVVDRRFFREHYDARRILASLIERSAGAHSATELGALVTGEIDRALHLEDVSFFMTEPAAQSDPQPPAQPPLPMGGDLEARLRAAPGSLDVDLERPDSGAARFSLHERQWLADGGYRMLVPVLGNGQDLLGALALGPKRSELGFSRDDRELLGDVARASALMLERWRVDPAPHALPEPAEAMACTGCGDVAESSAGSCPSCGGDLAAIPLPLLLLGKFRLEKSLGAGGMGVVYRARDLSLDRHVAIKTLPLVSPEAAVRLRREARTMASVVHPNLTLIYGVEAWRGTPILVLEYLSGGTLAAQLAAHPLDAARVAQLGMALAEALDAIHRRGILHRDVKPSNVGFAHDGTAKLMDFGLARIVSDALHASVGAPRPQLAGIRDPARTAPGAVVGTPLYLSPEALAGGTPDAAFDLWSLGVSLFEAAAGRHPMERASWLESTAAIAKADVPDLRRFRPDAPAELAEFFAQSLSLDRRRRPSSARELATRLSDLVDTL